MEKAHTIVSYNAQSRGHKTKGNTYKDRYVENTCPECQNPRAYKDEWKTRVKYTCLKRACRHQWYEKKTFIRDQDKTLETE
jgi:hypothetical protein